MNLDLLVRDMSVGTEESVPAPGCPAPRSAVAGFLATAQRGHRKNEERMPWVKQRPGASCGFCMFYCFCLVAWPIVSKVIFWGLCSTFRCLPEIPMDHIILGWEAQPPTSWQRRLLGVWTNYFQSWSKCWLLECLALFGGWGGMATQDHPLDFWQCARPIWRNTSCNISSKTWWQVAWPIFHPRSCRNQKPTFFPTVWMFVCFPLRLPLLTWSSMGIHDPTLTTWTAIQSMGIWWVEVPLALDWLCTDWGDTVSSCSSFLSASRCTGRQTGRSIRF